MSGLGYLSKLLSKLAWLRLFVGVVVYSLFTLSWAGGVSWSGLSTQEQMVLKEFEAQWPNFPTAKQDALKRWAGLPASQREQIRSQYTQWNSLPPARRSSLQRKLEYYRSLPVQKREKIKKWRNWIKGLPLMEQQKLREQWSQLGHRERKQYIQELAKKYGAAPL